MSEEFIPLICWKTFEAKNLNHVNNLVDTGFKGLRIFFNLADLPKKDGLSENSPVTEWLEYINHLFVYLPDGMHAWTFENFPHPFWSSVNNEKMKDSFDLCKKLNWLPIVCMGYSEEQDNWIERAPKEDKWKWLARFAKEFGVYLRNVYGFVRADLEVWNEPNKLISLGFGYDKYSNLALIMARAWKEISKNYKVHVFACDLQQQSYLDGLMQNIDLMNSVDYISTHALYHSEWDYKLIDTVNSKIRKYTHLRQALTEMSPLGEWYRFEKLNEKVSMYGLLLAIRNNVIGTAFEIDDVWIYNFNDPDLIYCSSYAKRDFLTYFNKAHYREAIMEYLRPDELQAVYDVFGFKTPYHWQTPNLYIVGEKDPNKTLTWADIDAMTETQLKGLISGLKKLNVLPANFPDYPNVKYKEDGNWNSNWQAYAKSKPL